MPRPISIHVAPLEGAPTPEHLALHLAAIEYELSAPITIESREDIQSQRHWSDKIKPFEHQIQNLITFCRRAPVALFADDVGLGKTISAGLVLNELQTRRKVRRALVLARGTIHAQWKQELFDKFGIKASHAVGQNLLSALQSDSPVIITSYETARDRMDEIRRVDFDMLIMDEAHKVRNLHPVANAPLVATRLRKALEDRAFQYVLMLTATPIYNRLWDIYSIIDCLRVARGHEHPLGSPEDFVDDYIADGPQSARRVRHESREKFRLKLQDYMVRTSRSSANLSFPKRVVKTVQCEASPVEVALEKLVQVLVNGLPAGAQSLTTLSLGEALMSSPRALCVLGDGVRS